MTKLRILSPFLVTLLAGAGCARDSGSIVATPREFILADTLTIVGVDDALPGHALHQVRTAMSHAPDRLLIADGASGEARLYGADGSLQATLGRRGAGPGEHRYLAWARFLPGDTVETFDGVARRFTYWSGGAVARDYQLSNSDASPISPAGPDVFLALQSNRPSRFALGTSNTDSVAAVLVHGGDQPPVELARLPYETRYAATLPTGGVIYTPLPLEPKAAFAAGKAAIHIGYPGSNVIRRFDVTGGELPPIQPDIPRKPLTSGARLAWQQSIIEGMPQEQQAAMRQYLEALPYSEFLPLFDTLLVDSSERLWVREFPVPGESSVAWLVFQDQQYIGRMVMPAADRLLHVSSDRAVVATTRGDGAEVVIVRRLQ